MPPVGARTSSMSESKAEKQEVNKGFVPLPKGRQNVLKLEEVTVKCYGQFQEEQTIKFREDAPTFLVGPSGSGKSSLLHLVYRIVSGEALGKDEGQVNEESEVQAVLRIQDQAALDELRTGLEMKHLAHKRYELRRLRESVTQDTNRVGDGAAGTPPQWMESLERAKAALEAFEGHDKDLEWHKANAVKWVDSTFPGLVMDARIVLKTTWERRPVLSGPRYRSIRHVYLEAADKVDPGPSEDLIVLCKEFYCCDLSADIDKDLHLLWLSSGLPKPNRWIEDIVERSLVLLRQDRGSFSPNETLSGVTPKVAMEWVRELACSMAKSKRNRFAQLTKDFKDLFGYCIEVTMTLTFKAFADAAQHPEASEELLKMLTDKLASTSSGDSLAQGHLHSLLGAANLLIAGDQPESELIAAAKAWRIVGEPMLVNLVSARVVPEEKAVHNQRPRNHLDQSNPFSSVRFPLEGSNRPPERAAQLPGSVQQGFLTLVALYQREGGTALLDEPTTGFDHSKRTKFRHILSTRLKEDHTRCLVVTHTPDLVSQDDADDTYYCSVTPSGSKARCLPKLFSAPSGSEGHGASSGQALGGLSARGSQRPLEPDQMKLFFVTRVLFVEGPADVAVLSAIVHEAENTLAVSERLMQLEVQPQLLSNCPVIALKSSSSTAPVAAATALRLPRGVILDGDSKTNPPYPALLQLDAIGGDRGFVGDDDMCRRRGVFIWEGEMEELFSVSPPAIRVLYNAQKAGDWKDTDPTDHELVQWMTTKKIAKGTSLFKKVGPSIHRRWPQVPSACIRAAVRTLILADDFDMTPLHQLLCFWQAIGSARASGELAQELAVSPK